jgi:hypothetical protein
MSPRVEEIIIVAISVWRYNHWDIWKWVAALAEDMLSLAQTA